MEVDPLGAEAVPTLPMTEAVIVFEVAVLGDAQVFDEVTTQVNCVPLALSSDI